jgi:phospholipid-transporting ATPase|tara:strand:+ start:85 stop:486 length:402 start_codon:yes stop_codon:yes gene_type:complete
MIKDAFEDYKRHDADASENEKTTLVYDHAKGEFQKRAWKLIYPGEILKIEDDEFLPCDILLLSSSDPNGLCYVETKSLDGETNLKIKQAHKDMQEAFSTQNKVLQIDGTIICEQPNNAIYKFEGAADIKQIEN